MRVISPKGSIKNIKKVYPFADAVAKFKNGKQKVVMERVDTLDDATGIILVSPNSFGGCSNDADIVVGNLPSEKVKEIMTALASQGYFDFSQLQYQKPAAIDKASFDDGSLPYTNYFSKLEDYMAVYNITSGDADIVFSSPYFNNPFVPQCPNQCPNQFPNQVVTDFDEEDDGDDEESSEGFEE